MTTAPCIRGCGRDTVGLVCPPCLAASVERLVAEGHAPPTSRAPIVGVAPIIEPQNVSAPPLRLTIPGAPRTKKNSLRRKMIGGRLLTIPSAAWCAWRDAVLLAIPHPPRAPEVPLNCCATFYRDADRGDAVGYYQGLADVLQELGVVRDDVLLAAWDGSRLALDRDDPRVVVVLTPLAP